MTNNATDTSREEKNLRLVINSIDLIPAVDRLSVVQSQAKQIYFYGKDNLYPQKYIETAKRSNSAMSAINTFADFLIGEGFGDSLKDIVINRSGLTLGKLNRTIRTQRASIGFGIHCAFNRLGQITDLTPIKFEYIRKKVEEKGDKWEMYRVKNNWEETISYFSSSFQKDYFAYNPEEAKAQIKEVGFENYSGQLFYFKGATDDIYPLGKADAAFDDMQFEAEAKLYGLSSVQNGYALGGIMKYPANLLDTHSNKEFESNFKKKGTGSANAGRILTVPIPPNTTIPNFFEATTQANVDGLFTNQKKEAKDNIFEIFSQPKSLSGRTANGVFNSEDIEADTYYYNSRTRQDSKDIDESLNSIFSYSIYPISNLKTIATTYIKETQNGNGTTIID